MRQFAKFSGHKCLMTKTSKTFLYPPLNLARDSKTSDMGNAKAVSFAPRPAVF